VVHTKYWSLAYGDNAAPYREALQGGIDLASTLYCYGDDFTPNKQEPTRLNTGITMIGKRSHLPDNLKVGRNCKIGTDLRPQDFPTGTLVSGETIEDRTFTHGWERELLRRMTSAPSKPPMSGRPGDQGSIIL